jgi:DNA topoisomerase IA
MRDRTDTDRMIESRMHRARIHQIRRAELLDAAQPLHHRQIDDGRFEAAQFDITVDWIAYQHRQSDWRETSSISAGAAITAGDL